MGVCAAQADMRGNGAEPPRAHKHRAAERILDDEHSSRRMSDPGKSRLAPTSTKCYPCPRSKLLPISPVWTWPAPWIIFYGAVGPWVKQVARASPCASMGDVERSLGSQVDDLRYPGGEPGVKWKSWL